MESRRAPSSRLISEEQLRAVDYEVEAGASRDSLSVEIFQKFGKVLISIQPRPSAVKSLYLAEKSRLTSRKGSRLGIGDHNSEYTLCSNACSSDFLTSSASLLSVAPRSSLHVSPPTDNHYFRNNRPHEKCFVYTQFQTTMNPCSVDTQTKPPTPTRTNKSDRVSSTLIIISETSSDTIRPKNHDLDFSHFNYRLDKLERKVMRQEMVVRSLSPARSPPSSEASARPAEPRPGCSYVQQYSHVPPAPPLTPAHASTIDRGHSSEQYGREFTTYDGLTARARRHSASVPVKHAEVRSVAAERVHKIRQKLNPVRDYRLMDTVHYLAQGEFAPRDDGIKLTPSREAVLSDIIWEDVCRTHWPSTRLSRRGDRPPRADLQRQIDGLLRERIAHVERRRRRHYRIIKLNHRHESCRPLGKTGDIIVANKHHDDGWRRRRDTPRGHRGDSSNANKNSTICMQFPELQRNAYRVEESSPGPSYGVSGAPQHREATCCFHTSAAPAPSLNRPAAPAAEPGLARDKTKSKTARLVVKKDPPRKYSKEEPNLEQFILLPTLVARTPSNLKRQKKFNALYHRILNSHLQNCAESDRRPGSGALGPSPSKHDLSKKDIGFNIHMASSNEN
ncbi:uncharacterized protein LOC119693065 [Plutella xylostella]|uniref:uncharacterized protein LOC119693065 n=1 Tax=Plutella xylostella TaxID=51655 RepID=UPI0020327768|nr:uncharacterized protein LOC119693065 [Plutella xylostella]